ncbi:ABC transporter permease [Asticcacaulis sp. EMRT-3]|uniref:ABC transporter permease n=1 Tax=Asticcacaulis sp. EMRT-3 TaxID=3040349 RepID=UPI0024AF0395|nr:ABC transporter permease [Asticcacaulis sp. EMRT-3]MDI7773991.1 ABC transporter permease [Asticcacaulis sp. EMRT-3]
MEQSWRQAKTIFAALIAAPLFWLVAFFLVPMAVVWVYSFGENKGLIDIAFTGTWSNYRHAFDPLYLGIFWKSIVVAAITTFLCLVVGFPVAMAITFASEKSKNWLLMLIMLPFWTNLLIRTYALIAVLRTEGYVNMIYHFFWNQLNALGFHLGDFHPLTLLYNNFAVVFGLVFVNLPFMVLPLYSTLDRMDRSLLEASLDLGAGHLRTIWHVMVPLAGPGIASGILITFIPALGAYLTPDLLGGPDSQMIANVIESQFKQANNWPFGAALSFILIYMTFIGIIVQGLIERANKRKVAQ